MDPVEMAKAQVKKRLLWWILVGGGASTLGIILGGIVFIVIIGVMVAGFGHWMHGLFVGAPPPMGTPTARSLEWLPAVVRADPALPAALGLSVIAQASGGQVYGDRYFCVQGTQEQSSGLPCRSAYGKTWTDLGESYGLTGVNNQDVPMPRTTSPHQVAWNLSTGLARLSQVLHTDPSLQTALPTFHRTTQAPPQWIFSGYAAAIRQDMATYGGPQMAAWALAPWGKISGTYQDPQGTKDWIFVVAGAPTGTPWTLQWRPPTVKTLTKTRQVPTTKTIKVKVKVHGKTVTKTRTVHGTKTVHYTVQQIITHNLTGRALAQPVSVDAKMANGTLQYFALSSTAGSNVPVWPGGVVWGTQLDLQQVSRIYAVWPGGLTESIPWPPESGVATGAVAHIPPTQAVARWWSDILVASRQTGVPADWIAAEMLNESGGSAHAGAQGLAGAYGLMQLEPATAKGLPGYTPGARQNAQENLILGAELLSAGYHTTQSWRAASAEYYGGLYTMERAGYQPGMPWSQSASVLQVIPFPKAGNILTMTAYADNIEATSHAVAAMAHK